MVKYYITILLFLSAHAGGYLKASHVMGADLTYTCLGGDDYEITISFYRDCGGINAPSNFKIDIYSVSCGLSGSVTLSKVAGTGQEVTPICPTATTKCNGGSYTGVQEYVYTGTITFPAQCDDWVISFSESARNSAITTLTNTNVDIYLEAMLNNKDVTCNSSPTFSNRPVPFICVGEEFCFNHGATDVDGDSLVYSLITPMTGYGKTVSYNAGYSASQPLKSNPLLTFDGTNGDFCVTPTMQEVTVMAVLVEEYRNGILIGSSVRDIQVTVMQCNNEMPSVNGINGTGSFDTTVCAGKQFCFDIYSDDPDASQIVTMSWNSGIKGASFTSTSAQFPVGTFCWTPPASAVSTNPYYFTVSVEDDNCPYAGSQTYSFSILVGGLNVDLGTDQSISCINQTTLNANGSGGNSSNYSYIWNTGETTTSINVSDGTYYVDLDDGTGCIASDTVLVSFNDAPEASFNVSAVCEGTPAVLTDASIVASGSINGWEWDFGDGGLDNSSNPSYQYLASGTYSVSLIVTSDKGCTDTAYQTVTVNSMPLAGFSYNNVCEGEANSFFDLTIISSGSYTIQWDMGDGNTSSSSSNFNYTYASSGTYSVILQATSDSGCVNSDTQNVSVSSSPVADFMVADACEIDSVTFTNGSSIAFGSITGYEWNLGDGNTSVLNSPVHKYLSPGAYTISLVAISDGGCADTLTSSINIFAQPVADFVYSDVCLGITNSFTDASTLSTGTMTWSWDFGDGNTSVSQSPSNKYSLPGTYEVILQVVSDSGCSSQDTNTVSVSTKPQAGFTANNVCEGEATVFTDASVIAIGSIIDHQWDFGDGNTTSQIPSPSNTYGSYGNYNVTLIAVSDGGCEDTTSSVVDVFAMPQANLLSSDRCFKDTMAFIDLSTSPTLIGSWSWAFSDGSSSDEQSPEIVFPAPGLFDAQLAVETTDGCKDTAQITVEVFPLPEPSFNAVDVCLGEKMSFSNLSTISSGSIDNWEWQFADGNTSVSQTPSHNYTTEGVYDVILVAESDKGCMDTAFSTVEVFPMPVVDFMADITQGCEDLEVNYSDQTYLAYNNISMYEWSLGSGISSSSENPNVTYENPGEYTVSLIITTNKGCKDSLTQTNYIEVYPLPVVNFIYTPENPTILTPEIVFLGIGNDVSNWNWEMGDGSFETGQDVINSYNEDGFYTVTLIGENQYGCLDTVLKVIKVDPVTTFYIPNVFTPNNDDKNDIFRGEGLHVYDYRFYIFDRWGNKIFSTTDLEDFWDGKIDGIPAVEDVYVYKAVYYDVGGEKHKKTGRITLVR